LPKVWCATDGDAARGLETANERFAKRVAGEKERVEKPEESG